MPEQQQKSKKGKPRKASSSSRARKRMLYWAARHRTNMARRYVRHARIGVVEEAQATVHAAAHEQNCHACKGLAALFSRMLGG